MTLQEQRNLDRVFGRLHVLNPKARLVGQPPNPIPTPIKVQVDPSPMVKRTVEEPAQPAPRRDEPPKEFRRVADFETSPTLEALRGTLPPVPSEKVKSKAAS